ncbi:acyl-CoA ligase (AMP-forming), exosortase A system-associated [Devosia sp. YIM 151766]|uniref:acyl-CoA ligase (AMP-forming), exosortase A system-associated n=1 Tax=Devosia sp. YIM 151766 TaxID=3017325 RepID=UPI00255C54FB|nr:acyl-CoA ligase (AMP-forming), exosortase A system-associated [Devosia sp. YIM 151766]WIY54223.1 acyl-CoA ligase (AMP-forming), exosortase A system-associated [Devosia sp. YIM 151766]
MKTGFHHLLRDMAAERPTSLALTYGSVSLDYAELWKRTSETGAVLSGLGLVRHDRVAIYLDKRPETVVAMFATSAAGGIFVPINPLLRAQQAAHILVDSGAKVLVTSADRLALLAPCLEPATDLRHVVTIDEADLPAFGAVEVHGWHEARGSDAFVSNDPIDLDLAAILYTSGSTGRPKGVALSHRNLLAGAESVSHYLGNSSRDVILAALPLSFDAGLSQLTTAFQVGAHVILLNYVLPQDVPRLCARHGVTGITAVPPLWIQLADIAWPDAARHTLRYFANTGGRMPRQLLGQLRAKFPQARPYLMYGLTEAFRSTYLDPAEIDRRPDSIGKAIPNVEIMVVRPDGTPCSPGEEGELVHRGALVAQGYWNDIARTAERFRPVPDRQQPWRAAELAVFSGDIVKCDEEGYLYYIGRRDEMIKTSGYRVSPTEIEEAAFETCLVHDAVAFGLEDERLGQRVVLVASPAGSGPLDTVALLSGMKQRLPLYMVPSQVIERLSIPRSPNGKFDRVLLRQELLA